MRTLTAVVALVWVHLVLLAIGLFFLLRFGGHAT
jgi:hypothetical protein